MRMLFLTLYPETAASPRYRVLQFLPYLRDHGIDCAVASLLTPAGYNRYAGPNRRGRAFWYHAIQRLRAPAERVRMGQAAREVVLEKYSLTQAAPRLSRLLESVA